MSGIDACIKVAKFTAAAGEMTPFPFIKGAAECVVLVLETFKSASKNTEDMQELAETIITILIVVRDTVIEHGPSSATRFQAICIEYQTCMADLLSRLNSGRRSQRGIRQYLRTAKVSDNINKLRQRVQAVQDSFLIRTTTMTRLALSDVHEEVVSLTGSVMASERNITSTIKDNTNKIRIWGARQSEDMQNLSARLQGFQRWGIYKGQVWDVIPGDIHIIKRATCLSESYRTVTYKDSYCTIGNSNTWKIIREYQAHGDNREDTMELEELDQALNFFMKQRHPNLPQIFGVCKSPDLPAIIFHGTTRIPFDHYLRDLPEKQFVRFCSELFQDLQLISQVLTSYTSHDQLLVLSMELEPFYFNEHGKLVFGDLICDTHYPVEAFKFLHVLPVGKYHIRPNSPDVRPSTTPLHGQISRWMLSSSSRERDLLNPYKAILFCHAQYINDEILWTQTFNRHRLQSPQYEQTGWSDSVDAPPYQSTVYARGSILTDPPSSQVPSTLVGRVQPWSHEWVWDISLWEGPLEEDTLSDNGTLSIGLSWDDVLSGILIRIRTPLGDEILQSWIAQTSKLHSCLRFRGYGDDLEAYIIEGVAFTIHIVPVDSDRHGPCRICNAEDRYHHALSLSITAPVIDHQTNRIESWPVVSCSRVCGMDSLEEEEVFIVKVVGYEFQARWGSVLPRMVPLTIPKLNAEYGFDPAREGADVCECFGWPLLEILDSSTGEWISNSTVSGSASVISDNPDRILREECNSALRGSIEEVQAGETTTKTEIGSVIHHHDISTRALIIIFIVIGIQIIQILSSFQRHL